MTETTSQDIPTAFDLLVSPQETAMFQTGIYTVEYSNIKQKQSNQENRAYYEHFFRIVDDLKNNNIMISVYSSMELKKGTKPEYDTKLYKIVSSLLKRPLEQGERISINGLIGKKCKVLISESNGCNDVTEFYKEDEQTPYDNK